MYFALFLFNLQSCQDPVAAVDINTEQVAVKVEVDDFVSDGNMYQFTPATAIQAPDSSGYARLSLWFTDLCRLAGTLLQCNRSQQTGQ